MSSVVPRPDAEVERHGRSDWIAAAIEQEPTRGTVAVDGASVAYRHWGVSAPERHDLVLVHGAAAHSSWWDHVGPLLSLDRRVTALDLTGHGDSARRSSYDMRTWAEEILAAAEAASPGSRPILVAHSMGGASALHAACTSPSKVSGLVLVDPLPHDVTSAETHARVTGKFGRQKVYASRTVAEQRFRVVPEQATLDSVLTHIAERSVREVDGGWTWKHDPLLYLVGQGGPADRRDVACPVAAVHAEDGLSDRTGAVVFGSALPVRQSIVIPGAQHHVMLDQPLALVSCLRTLLSSLPWSGPEAQEPAP